MEKKAWYKSKTMWAGIIAVAMTAYNSCCEQFGFPVMPEFIYAILGTFGLYGRTKATTKVG